MKSTAARREQVGEASHVVDTELVEAIRGVVRDELKPVSECLDGIDKRLDQVDERLDGIDKRLDQVDERLDGVDKRLDEVDKRLDGMDKRLDGMDKRLDEVDRRLDGMDQRFEQVDIRFEHIDNRFGQMDARFQAVDERFQEQRTYLDRRLTEQEKRLMAHMNTIKESLERKIQTIGESHLSLDSKLDGLHTELKKVAEASQRGDMELSRRLLEHEESHVNIRTDITQLQSQVGEIRQWLYIVEKKVFKESWDEK